MRSIKLNTLFIAYLVLIGCQGDSNVDMSTTGQGGSMTRFAIYNNYMYLVDRSQLNVFDIHENKFEKVADLPVTSGLETIFASHDFLYLGATDGMYIYNIAAPRTPTFVFKYSHIISCDPVVVQGNRAFVTLRNGSSCNRGSNALEILDITNPYSPELIVNHPMASPHGLAVDNDLLFLCEGEYGLKVFDISNELSVKLIDHIDDFFAYDVIARDGTLLITGEDGVFQYRYDGATGTLTQLSKIPVSRSDV